MDQALKHTFTIKRWLTATFLGWLLGVVFIIMLSSILDSIGIEGMQFYLGVGMGGGVGLAQWFFFRRQGFLNGHWIWTSLSGMGIPLVFFDLLAAGMAHKLAVSIAIGALLTGILQYHLLKRSFPKAFLWMPACFLGWTLAVGTVFIIDYTNQLKPWVSNNILLALINLFLILAGGIVLGLITGKGLKRILLLQHHTTQTHFTNI